MTFVQFKTPARKSDINNLFENLFTPLSSLTKEAYENINTRHTVPVNINESDTGYELELVAPGFNKEDFKIDIDKKLMTISVQKEIEENKEQKQIRKEYSFQSFKRSFTIDDKIDADNISAQYNNGVLILNLPRKQEVKEPVKQIKIN
jgi:HSP20 family protein